MEVTLDMGAFNRALNDMAKAVKKSPESVLPYHAASVLKLAAKYSKAFTDGDKERAAWKLAALRQKVTTKTDFGGGHTSVNIGIRNSSKGRVWWRSRDKTSAGNHKFVMMYDTDFSRVQGKSQSRLDAAYSVSQAVEDFQAELKFARYNAENSTEFPRKQFQDAIDDLIARYKLDYDLIPPKSAGFGKKKLSQIRSAKTITGKAWKPGHSVEVSASPNLKIAVTGQHDTKGSPQAKAFQSALAAREKAFYTEVDKGVFKSAEEVTKRYPFLKTI